jgi:hypothetical protein
MDTGRQGLETSTREVFGISFTPKHRLCPGPRVRDPENGAQALVGAYCGVPLNRRFFEGMMSYGGRTG